MPESVVSIWNCTNCLVVKVVEFVLTVAIIRPEGIAIIVEKVRSHFVTKLRLSPLFGDTHFMGDKCTNGWLVCSSLFLSLAQIEGEKQRWVL